MRVCWWCLLVCLSAKANAQLPDSAVWSVWGGRFEVDKLQQVYLVDEARNLRKYAPNGKEVFMYSNLRLGPLAQVDVTDPFNLLLYYPQFQTAVQLDRTLNERGRLSFLDLGYPQIDMVAQSRDNQLWIYEGLQNRLLKVNARGQQLAESQTLSLLPGGAPSPDFLAAAGNLVFLGDANKRLLIFDAFGQYVRSVPLDGRRPVQVWRNNLILVSDKGAWMMNTDFTFSRLALPEDALNAGHWRMSKNQVLWLTAKGLHIQNRQP